MNKLREFRKQYKLTQAELAELLKRSLSQIQRLESPDKKWGNNINHRVTYDLNKLREEFEGMRLNDLLFILTSKECS